jgi:hypothetical protein
MRTEAPYAHTMFPIKRLRERRDQILNSAYDLRISIWDGFIFVDSLAPRRHILAGGGGAGQEPVGTFAAQRAGKGAFDARLERGPRAHRLGRWFLEGLDENAMLSLLVGSAIIWPGVKVLVLLEAEETGDGCS